jgi:hypothetical protein
MSVEAWARKKYNQSNFKILDFLMNESKLCSTDISLSYKYLNSDEMKIIGEWLKNITTLTILSLRRNYITSDGASSLAEALMVNTSLTELDLTCNKIGNVGANAIFKMLQTNNTITSLRLGNNNISDIGIVSLENNTSLITLNLGHNKIDNEGLVSLVESIKHNRGLKTLDLSSNIIGDSGEAFTTLFKNNSTLLDLSISCANITQCVFDAFIDILNMPSFALKHFSIISEDEFWHNFNSNVDFNHDKLVDAIKYNTTLQEFTYNNRSHSKTITEVLERNKLIEKIYPFMCCSQRRGMYLPDEIWTKVANLS